MKVLINWKVPYCISYSNCVHSLTCARQKTDWPCPLMLMFEDAKIISKWCVFCTHVPLSCKVRISSLNTNLYVLLLRWRFEGTKLELEQDLIGFIRNCLKHRTYIDREARENRQSRNWQFWQLRSETLQIILVYNSICSNLPTCEVVSASILSHKY